MSSCKRRGERGLGVWLDRGGPLTYNQPGFPGLVRPVQSFRELRTVVRRTLSLFVILLALAAGSSPVRTQNADAPFVEGEVLIHFHAAATPLERAEARSWVGARRTQLLRRNGGGELELAAVPGRGVHEAVALLRLHHSVDYAEPNWIYRHQDTSNDPYYTGGSLWGMYGDTTAPANQYGSQAGEAWAVGKTGSSSVLVGVIDEGIDLNHPDLAANIWINPYDPIDGVDNDGNGYVDDRRGWDFVQNNNSIYDGSPTDSATDSHGTHVSGTIGAVGGNGIGVAGVNWNVKIISAKFLGPNGGTLANAVKAIDYIRDLKTRHGLSIVATNNSWGGGGYSQGLHEAIIRAAKANILFVAAAGNGNLAGVGQNNDTTPVYPSNYNTAIGTPGESPASYDAVIAVASITSSGAKSGFSNYGKTTVDLGAPGSGVWSTTPNNGYSSYSGTSMAAPHVTGAAALYKSLHPGAAASQVKTAILNSAVATPTASLNNITVTNGRLNIGQFGGLLPPPPNAPSALGATAVSSSQINLAWTDNSLNESGFDVERCQGTACTSFAKVGSVGMNVTTYSDTGRSASTTYRYRVRAFNAGGASGPSNEAQATTPAASASPPTAPNGMFARPGPSSGLIDLSWHDNSTNETGFKIERCPGSSCTGFLQIAQVGANVRTYRDSGRSPNHVYRYRVRAFNAAGDSAYSNIASATAP